MKILKSARQTRLEKESDHIDFVIGKETYRRIKKQTHFCPECGRNTIFPMGRIQWHEEDDCLYAICVCKCGCHYETDKLSVSNPVGKSLLIQETIRKAYK